VSLKIGTRKTMPKFGETHGNVSKMKDLLDSNSKFTDSRMLRDHIKVAKSWDSV